MTLTREFPGCVRRRGYFMTLRNKNGEHLFYPLFSVEMQNTIENNGDARQWQNATNQALRFQV